MKPDLEDQDVLEPGAAHSAPDLDPSGIEPILRLLTRASDVVLFAALIGELGAVFTNVIARSLFATAFLWTDEVAKLALSTLAFIGGAAAYGRGQHGFVQAVIGYLPPASRRACLILADLVVLGVVMISGFFSIFLLDTRWGELTPILQIPAATIVLPLSIGMALIAIHAVGRLILQHRPTAILVVSTTAALLGLLLVTRVGWLAWVTSDAAIALAIGLLVLAVFLGLPIGFALLLGTTVYLWSTDAAPMVALPQNMVDGTGNFVLLALPFFIFAGLIMERGGISLRLVRFVQTLVGHLRGGLLHVMVASMYLVSGLSGSKTADVAAVGSVMRDMLRKQGYSPAEGAAVLAASAAMGETVPPSIAMLVLGSVTSLSMAALFVGGLIPAAVVAICLMGLIALRARSGGSQFHERAPLMTIVRAGLQAVPALLMPVILFAGILMGVATPTEVSSFAVVYGLLLSCVIYRELTMRQLLRTVIDAATLAGMVLFVLGAASSFSWVLAVANLPQRLVEILEGFHNNAPMFIIGSSLLLITIGSLLEGLPALIILAPLLLPIAGQIGLSQLHYGMVLLIAMGVGAFMPPVGVGFYVACAILRTDIESASRAMLPYFIVLLIGLLIVAFMPSFTLFLPNYFNLGS